MTKSKANVKSRIFITGSADGLGHAAAKTLLAEGHEVVVHVRSKERLSAVNDLLAGGAIATIGDLANFKETHELALQVNKLGQMDAVIHNAGVYKGDVAGVNVLAPYVLTALIARPQRLIYLSSGMHLGGRASLDDLDWNTKAASISYSDSKLLITTFCAGLAKCW
ncbi:MAG: SDR family NAD(P)-dependent oxidoreductase [Candidatus Obscuribacterales bacterium]